MCYAGRVTFGIFSILFQFVQFMWAYLRVDENAARCFHANDMELEVLSAVLGVRGEQMKEKCGHRVRLPVACICDDTLD